MTKLRSRLEHLEKQARIEFTASVCTCFYDPTGRKPPAYQPEITKSTRLIIYLPTGEEPPCD